jgi:oligosaccharyltransferase complex subunit beta
MLSLSTIIFSLFGLFVAAVQAKSSTGNSVLVLLQPDLNRNNFTIFFDNLQSKLDNLLHQPRALNGYPERGYDLTFRYPKADTPRILEDDIPTFNHIILFSPDTKCEKITHGFAFSPDVL